MDLEDSNYNSILEFRKTLKHKIIKDCCKLNVINNNKLNISAIISSLSMFWVIPDKVYGLYYLLLFWLDIVVLNG